MPVPSASSYPLSQGQNLQAAGTFRFHHTPKTCRQALYHILSPDRQCHGSALSVQHRIEVNITVFTAHPAAGHQRRRKAHEPAVGIIVGQKLVLPPISAFTPGGHVRLYLH